jgi:CRISPR-associated protein Csb1
VDLDTLASLVNSASALSLVADLQSAERTPDGYHLVAPPTYANAASNGTGYLLVGYSAEDGHADSVRLDSPQSMAHRLTQVLAEHGITSNIVLLNPAGKPLLTKEGMPVHSSMLSHRASDAILQDSQVNGVPFRESAIGKAVLQASKDTAGAWWQYFPEVLLFGFWDSFAKVRSGVPHGAKVARSLLAEIYGYDLRGIPGGATKVDLLGINNSAGKLYLDEHHQVGVLSPSAT